MRINHEKKFFVIAVLVLHLFLFYLPTTAYGAETSTSLTLSGWAEPPETAPRVVGPGAGSTSDDKKFSDTQTATKPVDSLRMLPKLGEPVRMIKTFIGILLVLLIFLVYLARKGREYLEND